MSGREQHGMGRRGGVCISNVSQRTGCVCGCGWARGGRLGMLMQCTERYGEGTISPACSHIFAHLEISPSSPCLSSCPHYAKNSSVHSPRESRRDRGSGTVNCFVTIHDRDVKSAVALGPSVSLGKSETDGPTAASLNTRLSLRQSLGRKA